MPIAGLVSLRQSFVPIETHLTQVWLGALAECVDDCTATVQHDVVISCLRSGDDETSSVGRDRDTDARFSIGEDKQATNQPALGRRK